MDKIKQKLINVGDIAFLVLMVCVYVLSFLGKLENKVKAEETVQLLTKSNIAIKTVDNLVEDKLQSLFFDTVRQVTYANNAEMEFYQIAYDNYLISATHRFPLKFQKESWDFYCVNKEGDWLDTKYISDNTEQILRCICLQNTPKSK